MKGGLGGKALLSQPCLALALDWVDPASAFAAFAGDSTVAWLDSQGEGPRARYSYLAVEPFDVLSADAGDPCPFDTLAARMARYPCGWTGSPVPFWGGAVGFLAYEAGSRLEGVAPHGGEAGPRAFFGFYDVVLAFDRAAKRCWLLSSGFPEHGTAREARAGARAAHVLARLAAKPTPSPSPPPLAWRAETSRDTHIARVARTIAYIEAGDIYQANITARFLADAPEHIPAAGLYRALRAHNPAPYGAYLACAPDLAIASVSPERFLGLTAEGRIEARPIKGTRPRGADAAQDAALVSELLRSAKDHSENLMIADLLRHDIGRVARIGSVHVPELAALETFPNLHHLVSAVRGTLRPGLSAADLLRAAFPGGSITGAPKRRAMQIIRELEPAPRNAYCGTVAWLGWDGAADSSIAIRTLTISRGQVTAAAGGGIVAESQPEDEYEEMLVKIRPLLRALGPFGA